MRKCITVTSTLSYTGKAKAIWLLILLFAALRASAQNVSINDSVAVVSDNLHLGKTINQVNLTGLRFTKSPGNRIDFGIVGSEYKCVILKLSSPHNVPGQYLSIDNTSLDTISIYQIYSDGTSRLLYQGGSLIHFDTKRNYVWHTVPVEINEKPTFYLIAIKASQKNINIRYEILDKDHLQKKYHASERIVFYYLGIVSMITAIMVLAFFLFKNAVFAAYLGYIICVSGWILSHYGRMFSFVYPQLPQINEIAKPVTSLGACVFLIIVLRLVFRQHLQSQKRLQQLLKWMQYILLLLTGLMFLLLIYNLAAEVKFALIVAWHIGLIVAVCIIVFTPVYFIKSGFTAKIFSAAMLVVCLIAMVQLFGNLGFINNLFTNEHGMTIGSLIEISIMAFGIFYNLLQENKYKERQVLVLEQEQTETVKKLITVQDNERKRITGDLHDNIGPLLAALKINFRRIINTKDGDLQNGLIGKTESIIDDSIAEIRNVAHNLMPKGLSSNGLINTLNEYFESIQQLYNKTIQFHHQIQSILNPDLQINVYRITCELVLNAARHSNAHLITVHITSDEKFVCINIHDDGQGFQKKSNNQKTSLGLQNAESRVLYLKGKFSLKTECGKGTVIDIKIPLQFYETKVNSF